MRFTIIASLPWQTKGRNTIYLIESAETLEISKVVIYRIVLLYLKIFDFHKIYNLIIIKNRFIFISHFIVHDCYKYVHSHNF